MPDIKPKQAKFVEEYLIDFNATQAAIRAGYSKRRASEIGWQLLQKPHVQEVLSERARQLAAEAGVTLEKVIAKLVAVAFANMDDYATWSDDGVHLTPSADLTREQTAAVQEISERRTETVTKDGGTIVTTQVKIKLYSKTAAFGKLEKYIEWSQMGMVSWRDMLEALAEMSRAVEMYVTDPATIDKIRQAWSRIPIRPTWNIGRRS